jgi:hypothetical protein
VADEEREPRTSEELPPELEESQRERERRIAELKRKLDQGERFEKIERSENLKRWGKTAVIVGVAILLLAGAIAGINKLSELTASDCPAHDHATFRLFINGTQISFQDQRWDMAGVGRPGKMPMKAHLHQPNDYLMHLEGGCTSVRQWFGYLDVDLKQDSITLDNIQHDGSTYRNNDTMMLRFYLWEPSTGNWTEKPDILGYQMRDKQRLLVTYGVDDPVMLAQQQAAVPPVPANA